MFDKRLNPHANPNDRIGVVFFEPQTGIYKREDWQSNYYHFRLRNSHPQTHQFTSDWLEQNIAQATVTPNGLEYPQGFLEQLAQSEQQADQDFAKHPEFNIPQKLQ
jgi:hypothetical protein